MKEKLEAANVQLCGILDDIKCVVAEAWQAETFSRIRCRVKETQKLLSEEDATTCCEKCGGVGRINYKFAGMYISDPCDECTTKQEVNHD